MALLVMLKNVNTSLLGTAHWTLSYHGGLIARRATKTEIYNLWLEYRSFGVSLYPGLHFEYCAL